MIFLIIYDRLIQLQDSSQISIHSCVHNKYITLEARPKTCIKKLLEEPKPSRQYMKGRQYMCKVGNTYTHTFPLYFYF